MIAIINIYTSNNNDYIDSIPLFDYLIMALIGISIMSNILYFLNN